MGELRHDALFSHLRDEEFTAAEAAAYLEVSIATFRRDVQAGKITARSSVGNSHLYPLTALRQLKKAIQLAKSPCLARGLGGDALSQSTPDQGRCAGFAALNPQSALFQHRR